MTRYLTVVLAIALGVFGCTSLPRAPVKADGGAPDGAAADTSGGSGGSGGVGGGGGAGSGGAGSGGSSEPAKWDSPSAQWDRAVWN